MIKTIVIQCYWLRRFILLPLSKLFVLFLIDGVSFSFQHSILPLEKLYPIVDSYKNIYCLQNSQSRVTFPIPVPTPRPPFPHIFWQHHQLPTPTQPLHGQLLPAGEAVQAMQPLPSSLPQVEFLQHPTPIFRQPHPNLDIAPVHTDQMQLTTFQPAQIPAPMITNQMQPKEGEMPDNTQKPGPSSGPPALISAPSSSKPPLPTKKPLPPPPLPPMPLPTGTDTSKKNHGAILTSLALMIARIDGPAADHAVDLIIFQKKMKIEQAMGRMSQDNSIFRDYCFWLHEKSVHTCEGKASEYYRSNKGLFPLSAYCIVEYPSRDGIRYIPWGLAMAHPSLVQIDPCPVIERGKSLRAKITLKGTCIREQLGSPYMYGAITTPETITIMRAQTEGRFRCAHARFVVPLKANLGQSTSTHPECPWCPHSVPELHMVSPTAKNRKRGSPFIEPASASKYEDPKNRQERYAFIKRNRVQFYNMSTIRDEIKLASVPSLAGVIYPVIKIGERCDVQPQQGSGEQK